ncbi:MAG: threonine synthase [Planctomycetota bacterium]|nr:MAG: threonine synthase [Planctomycetota bacterium]
MSRSWFRDAITGEGHWSLDEVIYRSPAGNLLEVVHDLSSLKAQGPDKLKALWDSRWGPRTPTPFHSGIWGKKELVLPDIPDEHVVTLDEGHSSLLPMGRYAEGLGLDREQLLIKQCGNSHSGSFKDLGMTVLVSQVNHLIRSGKQDFLGVACASSGDTSAALAAYAAAAGIPAVVLLPNAKVSPAQLVQPLANGALTLALDTDFDGCMKVVRELTHDGRLYLANSMNSLRIEGQKTVAIEIIQQLGWEVPEWIFISGGNLGNTAAIYKGLEELLELGVIGHMPKLVCCQAAAADPLYRCFQNGWRGFQPVVAAATQASAIRIGDPVSVPKAMKGLIAHGGEVAHASESELAEACARADAAGFFTCPHTGVTLAAVEQYAARGAFAASDRIVVISTAHGLKFAETKAAYHGNKLADVQPERANQPQVLKPSIDAVYEAVEAHRRSREG